MSSSAPNLALLVEYDREHGVGPPVPVLLERARSLVERDVPITLALVASWYAMDTADLPDALQAVSTDWAEAVRILAEQLEAHEPVTFFEALGIVRSAAGGPQSNGRLVADLEYLDRWESSGRPRRELIAVLGEERAPANRGLASATLSLDDGRAT